jgi:hypothetical protein
MNYKSKSFDNTIEPLVRLSFLVNEVMEKCRKDLMRHVQDFDYCEVCPLLKHCHAQEHEPNLPPCVNSNNPEK